MQGFFKRVLFVDASNRTSRAQEIDAAVLRRYMGGQGLATHLLDRHNPPGVDPLAPENNLIIALGPVTDSPIYGSCRYGVYSKSPLTGFYGSSYSGGTVAVPMSRTGYDAFVIQGASSRPVWIEITDEAAVFHDAQDIWGRDTYSTEDAVKKSAAAANCGAIVIGPAGEKKVRFAVIENDYWRSAGRCGMGAVLGAKKVKALVFHGSQKRPLADPEGIKAYAKACYRKLKDHPTTQAFREQGTTGGVAALNSMNAFPTRYWSQGRFDRWEQISAERLIERLNPTARACRTCFMGCSRYLTIPDGPYAGTRMEGPEYETLYTFGGLCMIDSIDGIVYLNDVCDRLGMDTITAGNLAAFAIEASRRGKLDLALQYGRVDQVADLLHRVAAREGVGDLLADGIRPASEQLGLADLAVHVKGMEPAGFDPRVLKGMGLAYAVSERGACHLRSTFYLAEMGELYDPASTRDTIDTFLDFENRCTLHDCLIVCRFYRDFYMWDEMAHLIEMATGINIDKPALAHLAARVKDAARRFNLREGMTAADDRLPRCLVEERLEESQSISATDIDTLVRAYYQARGWDPDGIPPETEAGQ